MNFPPLARPPVKKLILDLAQQERRVSIDNEAIDESRLQQPFNRLKLLPACTKQDDLPFEQVLDIHREGPLVHVAVYDFAFGVEKLAKAIGNGSGTFEILKFHAGQIALLKEKAVFVARAKCGHVEAGLFGESKRLLDDALRHEDLTIRDGIRNKRHGKKVPFTTRSLRKLINDLEEISR